MAKPIFQPKPSNLTKQMPLCIAATSFILVFWALWSLKDPWPTISTLLANQNCPQISKPHNMTQDPLDATFYDDPKTRYTIDKPMNGWDEKRKNWLNHHPTFVSKNRVLVLTGSQPSSCKNPLGDHWLLRFFKNKVDYCRIHGYDIFYNNALLDPKMGSYWAKIPLVRAAMMAHPEAEWILWVDSDAIFTDMDFKIPLERYKDHNLVIHGWPNLIYEKKSWVAVNAGIFLMRNCQWSMDFLDVWARMGPKSPDYAKWGRILRSTLKDKLFPESDDQSALVYLLLKEKKKWGHMIYVENEYCLHGYWLGIVNKFDDIKDKYVEIEKVAGRGLRRRHAEAVSERYAAAREGYLGESKRRRPFITHFTGCQPCSGDHNPEYKGDTCWVGMERALNFADNQVLRNYGFVHPDVEDGGSSVRPLPFDYPGDEFI